MLALGPLPQATRSLAFHPSKPVLYAATERTPRLHAFDLFDAGVDVYAPATGFPIAAITISDDGCVLAAAPYGKPVWNVFWEIHDRDEYFFEVPDRGEMTAQFSRIPLEINNHGGPGWPAFQLFQRENKSPWSILGMQPGERRSLVPGMVLCAPRSHRQQVEPYLRGRRASRDMGDPEDVRDYEPLTLWNGLLRAFAISPRKDQVALGFKDGTIILRHWPGGIEADLSWQWEIGAVSSLAFSPDGTMLAAGGDSRIVVWDLP